MGSRSDRIITIIYLWVNLSSFCVLIFWRQPSFTIGITWYKCKIFPCLKNSRRLRESPCPSDNTHKRTNNLPKYRTFSSLVPWNPMRPSPSSMATTTFLGSLWFYSTCPSPTLDLTLTSANTRLPDSFSSGRRQENLHTLETPLLYTCFSNWMDGSEASLRSFFLNFQERETKNQGEGSLETY